MPRPEWLEELRPVEGLQNTASVIAHLLHIQSALLDADEQRTAINLDSRPALLRVAGFKLPTSHIRYLLAVALGDNPNFVSVERHGYNYNSVSSGCNPRYCGVAQLELEESPSDGAGTYVLGFAEGAGALLAPQDLVYGLRRAVDWLGNRQGAEDPRDSRLGRTVASVMLTEREHEMRLHYLGEVVEHVLAA